MSADNPVSVAHDDALERARAAFKAWNDGSESPSIWTFNCAVSADSVAWDEPGVRALAKVIRAAVEAEREEGKKLAQDVLTMRGLLADAHARRIQAEKKIDLAATTLRIAINAADETFNTVDDDADAAATIACTLRDGTAAAIKILGAPIQVAKVEVDGRQQVHDAGCDLLDVDPAREGRYVSATEPCPTCKGGGEVFSPCIYYADNTSGPGLLPCPDCRASGVVPAGHAERVEAGKKLRAERLAAGLSLRDWCRKHGEDPTVRSRRERGFDFEEGATRGNVR